MGIDPNKHDEATIHMSRGDFTIELFARQAPHHRQQLHLPGRCLVSFFVVSTTTLHVSSTNTPLNCRTFLADVSD